MLALCHVANTPQMTCLPDTCWHVSKMSGMSADIKKRMSSRPAKQYVDKTSSKILPTCWLNLLDIKKKQQIFTENRAVMV